MAFPQAEAGFRVMRLVFGTLIVGAGLLGAATAWGADNQATVVSPPHPPPLQPGAAPSEGLDRTLSPECRVPGSKLYSLAKLKSVKAALKAKRPIRVLSVGSTSAGLGASASYPVRLESSLQRSLPNVEIEVESRGLAGEIAGGAAERLRTLIAEVEPDLVVWQVGSNDALARVDIEAFDEALRESITWLNSHEIDVVLVDPLFTQSLADDEYYNDLVQRVRAIATQEGVPLVLRYEAMRFLSAGDKDVEEHMLGRQFRLNDLGLRCMAEHVTRAITLSLLQPDVIAPGAATPPQVPASQDAPAAPPKNADRTN